MPVHANSIRNLRPIRPEDRITNGRTGKSGIRADLRRAGDANYDKEYTYHEKIVLELVTKAVGGSEEKPTSEMGQLRAIQEYLNRRFGMPKQAIQHSGSIGTESPEEQRAKLEARKREILSGERQVEVQEAEFIDIQPHAPQEIQNDSAE